MLAKKDIKNKIAASLYILFLIALLSHLVKQFIKPYGIESWQVSEFLINYQGGFVRRGLLGELLFSFASHFAINIEIVVKAISAVFYFLLCYFFTRSFIKKGYSLYILPLCFFLGSFILADVWIRKDTMMLCFFIAILSAYKMKLHFIIKVLAINLLLIFMILTHEVFVFFTMPVLLLLFFSHLKQKGAGVSFMLSALSLLPAAAAFIIVTIKHGDQDIAQVIWNSWQNLYGYEKTGVPFLNSIGSIGWTSSYALNYHLKTNFFLIDNGILSSFVWLLTFPLIYYISTNALLAFRTTPTTFTDKDKTLLSAILLFQLLFLLPVFILLSCDYGRVIPYWILSSFAIFLIIPGQTIQDMFPTVVINKITQLNNYLYHLLTPTKSVVFLLIMLVGISGWAFTMDRFYRTSMLYQIIWIVSKPFVILDDILLNSH